MADYDLQYTGQQVDDALGKILDGTIDAAVNRAINAGDIATAAAASAQTASAAAVPAAAQAVASATESKSWAVGGTGSRSGEDTDNAKYYASVAREIAGGDYTTPTEARGIANQQIDARAAKLYEATATYAAGAQVVHNGYVWRNTSGGTVTGVEPGTDYNKWNVGFSNPNLLDNWYLANPINKRNASGDIVDWNYGYDRWLGFGFGIGQNNTIYKKSGSSYFSLIQKIEQTRILPGKAYTISFKSADGKIYSESGVLSTTQGFTLQVDSTTRFEVFYADSWTAYTVQGYFNLEQIAIESIKLELGPISTLANDGPPDYGTELIKCMTSTADPSDAYANCELSPKMETGVEYRTTERYMGKPVYVKLYECGEFPAAGTGKTVSLGIQNLGDIVRHEETSRSAGLPSLADERGTTIARMINVIGSASGAPHIQLASNLSSPGSYYLAYVKVFYTKTTD